MTEKSCIETDAWEDRYWRDPFEPGLVDADVSLDFSQSLWDELTRNDLEATSAALSTPITDDALLTDSPTFPRNRSRESSEGEEEGEGEEEKDGNTTVHGSVERRPPARLKRRRLFNAIPHSTFSRNMSCVDAVAVALVEPMMLEPPLKISCFEDPPLKHDGELSCMAAIWYAASNDHNQRSLQESTLELLPMSENWMSTCVEDNQRRNGFQGCKKETAGRLVKQTTGGLAPLKPFSKEIVLQGPLTPFSSQPSTRVNTIAVKKFNLSTPVAYPFTLVKPMGVLEGDMTLMDINQLITSITPPRRTPLLGGGSVSTNDLRPNMKVDYGVGLSGKLVVTRTRICTKGNGTITILRTKG
ncbi:unnamed protein product [Sphagnum jensenii]|uniref:Protein XRI1 n=1 Tax=Sphagnum jensenii TaxID=128206 RepID=A0ABP1BQE7_9BRYO